MLCVFLNNSTEVRDISQFFRVPCYVVSCTVKQLQATVPNKCRAPYVHIVTVDSAIVYRDDAVVCAVEVAFSLRQNQDSQVPSLRCACTGDVVQQEGTRGRWSRSSVAHGTTSKHETCSK